jgi:hypothetical protein
VLRDAALRAAGGCFSAGFDLASNNAAGMPYATAMGDGFWPRHVVEGWFRIWDLAKPVTAQVPSDLQQLNKRSVHRAMEIMGMRAAIRAGTEIQALGWRSPRSLGERAVLRGRADVARRSACDSSQRADAGAASREAAHAIPRRKSS